MEKELKKAKFRLLSLDDQAAYQAFVQKMPGDVSSRMRFAFMHIWQPFARIYVRETERFMLLIVHDLIQDCLCCMPPLGDWQAYSLTRPLETYFNLFKAVQRKFCMINISEWMLPKLREAGLQGMKLEKNAEENDCQYMAQDYVLSLKREQSRAELEKIASSQSLKWIDYSAETQAAFYAAVSSVYDNRLGKLDKKALYDHIFSLLTPLDIHLCMLRGENNLLGLFGYRIAGDEMELLLYYAAPRPKGAEATVRQAISQKLSADVCYIRLSGSFHEGSLIAGKQAELRSTQQFNYIIREK